MGVSETVFTALFEPDIAEPEVSTRENYGVGETSCRSDSRQGNFARITKKYETSTYKRRCYISVGSSSHRCQAKIRFSWYYCGLPFSIIGVMQSNNLLFDGHYGI